MRAKLAVLDGLREDLVALRALEDNNTGKTIGLTTALTTSGPTAVPKSCITVTGIKLAVIDLIATSSDVHTWPLRLGWSPST